MPIQISLLCEQYGTIPQPQEKSNPYLSSFPFKVIVNTNYHCSVICNSQKLQEVQNCHPQPIESGLSGSYPNSPLSIR